MAFPINLLHQVWKESEDDQRGLGGDQISMALDSWNLLYGYLGDQELHRNMRAMADFWLAHGLTDEKLLYGGLPYPYNTNTNQASTMATCGQERIPATRQGGQLWRSAGHALQITGDKRYLKAAVHIADTLARTVTAGDSDHSPWPFRVDASSGKAAEDPRGSTMFTASYTTNWTPTLRLFEKLAELHAGDGKSYRRAHAL